MIKPDLDTIQIEAATYRRLLHHLMHERPDVRNVDLMAVAGFCRNCLADWYREAAEMRGITMTRDEAREAVYGMPFEQWQARDRRDGPEQAPASAALQRDRG